jgi:hypothetical protein
MEAGGGAGDGADMGPDTGGVTTGTTGDAEMDGSGDDGDTPVLTGEPEMVSDPDDVAEDDTAEPQLGCEPAPGLGPLQPGAVLDVARSHVRDLLTRYPPYPRSSCSSRERAGSPPRGQLCHAARHCGLDRIATARSVLLKRSQSAATSAVVVRGADLRPGCGATRS